jgi:hypothetical protein
MEKREPTLNERITLLTDLNRPLEEHWSLKTKFGLDAKESDYIYKHHVSRLENVYAHHHFQVKSPPKMHTMSPVSQLYGIKGLRSTLPGHARREKNREKRWVDNFQKYKGLEEGDPFSSRPPRPHSASSHRSLPNHDIDLDSEAGFDFEADDEESDHHGPLRLVTHDGMSSTDILMLNLYHLNPQQRVVFDQFVDLLKSFDVHDMINIIEDVIQIADTDDILDDYDGIDFAPIN